MLVRLLLQPPAPLPTSHNTRLAYRRHVPPNPDSSPQRGSQPRQTAQASLRRLRQIPPDPNLQALSWPPSHSPPRLPPPRTTLWGSDQMGTTKGSRGKGTHKPRRWTTA